MAVANAFLEAEYWADHNRRFAQAPASPDDFHLAVPRGVSLDQVFRLEETRTVSNDWVVRYANRHFQVERQSHQPPARSTVQLFEDVAGQIEIRDRDRRLRWTEIAAPILRTALPVTTPAIAPLPAVKKGRRRGQSADHPWHHGVEDYRTRLQLAAAKRAWMAVQP